jgi:hypothetical protein
MMVQCSKSLANLVHLKLFLGCFPIYVKLKIPPYFLSKISPSSFSCYAFSIFPYAFFGASFSPSCPSFLFFLSFLQVSSVIGVFFTQGYYYTNY